MPTLFLIRHGENDFLKNKTLAGLLPGTHLNQRGREQAAALAATLKDLPIEAIYSSPMERAIETAAPLAAARRLQVQIRPALTETNVGAWVNRQIKDLSELPEWTQLQEQPSLFRFPKGESFLECQERVVTDLITLLNAHPANSLIAAFFHGDPIKLALAHFIGLPLDHFQKLMIAPGSVTILKFQKNRFHLIAMNLIPPFNVADYLPPVPPDNSKTNP